MAYAKNDDLVLFPVNTITAGSLKDAAATSLGKFAFPKDWATCLIIKMGFTAAAAGGAQTTAGTMKLQIAGADVENASAVDFTAASVVSHAAWAQVETDLNSVTSSLSLTSNNYNAVPNYPEADTGELIELLVATQGVGAGDQTIFPYLVVRRKES